MPATSIKMLDGFDLIRFALNPNMELRSVSEELLVQASEILTEMFQGASVAEPAAFAKEWREIHVAARRIGKVSGDTEKSFRALSEIQEIAYATTEASILWALVAQCLTPEQFSALQLVPAAS